MKTLVFTTRYLYKILVFIGIILLVTGCNSEARSSLKCPGKCTKDCKYKATLSGKKDPKACGGKGGYSIVEVMIFKESPEGEDCVADVDREPKGAKGYIKWKLCDATDCKLTAENFPDGSPVPYNPNALPPGGLPAGKKAISKKCYASFTTGGDPDKGGGYTYKDIKSLELDYDIVTFCQCDNKKNEGTLGFKDALK